MKKASVKGQKVCDSPKLVYTYSTKIAGDAYTNYILAKFAIASPSVAKMCESWCCFTCGGEATPRKKCKRASRETAIVPTEKLSQGLFYARFTCGESLLSSSLAIIYLSTHVMVY